MLSHNYPRLLTHTHEMEQRMDYHLHPPPFNPSLPSVTELLGFILEKSCSNSRWKEAYAKLKHVAS